VSFLLRGTREEKGCEPLSYILSFVRNDFFQRKKRLKSSSIGGVGGNEAEMNGHGYEWKLISGSIIQKIDRKKFQTTSFAWSPRKRESEGKEEREGGGGEAINKFFFFFFMV